MILVTGGTGLVGAHLLLHLIQEGETAVRALFREAKQIEKTGWWATSLTFLPWKSLLKR
jgi:uncharacterized protein YbjT (DUF2867 family)